MCSPRRTAARIWRPLPTGGGRRRCPCSASNYSTARTGTPCSMPFPPGRSSCCRWISPVPVLPAYPAAVTTPMLPPPSCSFWASTPAARPSTTRHCGRRSAVPSTGKVWWTPACWVTAAPPNSPSPLPVTGIPPRWSAHTAPLRSNSLQRWKTPPRRTPPRKAPGNTPVRR